MSKKTVVKKEVRVVGANDLICYLDKNKNLDIKEVKRLIAGGANLEATNNFGQTPLALACSYLYEGYEDSAKILIKAGANIESKSIYGWTPLMCAAHLGAIKTIKNLVKAGAKVDFSDMEFCMAVVSMGEQNEGYAEMVDFLKTSEKSAKKMGVKNIQDIVGGFIEL